MRDARAGLHPSLVAGQQWWFMRCNPTANVHVCSSPGSITCIHAPHCVACLQGVFQPMLPVQ